jgi:ectoine hydroxylase-related dioxygenase (phytanoyl-CoA dioxygenase family)
MDYRHSLLDDNPSVQAVCRLPQVLAAVGALIGEVFFLAQVEGREPLPGCGHQRLHRDLSMRRPGDIANAMAYFDDYGPDNGAARLVPGSHRPQAAAPSTMNRLSFSYLAARATSCYSMSTWCMPAASTPAVPQHSDQLFRREPV